MERITIKRYLSVIAVALAITSNAVITSCSCDEDYRQETEMKHKTRAVVPCESKLNLSKQALNKVLKFDNEEEFERMATKVEMMNHEDIATIVKSKDDKFVSLLDIYEMAMEDAAELDASKESYYNYKSVYSPYLFFATYLDDCSAYLPVNRKGYAALLNAMGNVEIGGRIVNKLDIKDYLSLQKSGKAMYASASTQSTGSWSPGYIDHGDIPFSESADNIGQEFDSGWWIEDGRKIRLKCGRNLKRKKNDQFQSVDVMKLHIEVSFRKKTWVGWVNYSSETETIGTFTGGYDNGSYRLHKEENSSHDDWQDITYSKTRVDALYNNYYNPSISANLTINYRGIPHLLPISFTLPPLNIRVHVI